MMRVGDVGVVALVVWVAYLHARLHALDTHVDVPVPCTCGPVAPTAPPPARPPPYPATPDAFYPSIEHPHKLDYPILGKPLPGDWDQYDTVYGAIVSVGTIIVKGAGRIILDGARSDVIFKVNGEYESMRENFGYGEGIDRMEAPTTTPNQISNAVDWSTQLCNDIDPYGDGVGCTWRNSWGLDSCSDDVCVCGGGWTPYSSHVRIRHLNISNNSAAAVRFLKRDAAMCCAPDAEPGTHSCAEGGWLDKVFNCDKPEKNTLCDIRDRDQYLRVYQGISLDDELSLSIARQWINNMRWSSTRNLILDDGRWYHIALADSVWRACPLPRLKMEPHRLHGNRHAAVWSCDEGTRLRFNYVPPKVLRQNVDPDGWYNVTAFDGEDWYCIAQGGAESIVFTPDMDVCKTIYLGGRMENQLKPITGIGYGEDKSVIAGTAAVMVYVDG
jgi:hypothetical protein